MTTTADDDGAMTPNVTSQPDARATVNGLPRKRRELQNHHLDSTRWNEFRYRPGDIVIATWAKSGTTWMQQIVAELVFNAADDIRVAELSPWIELRWYPKELMVAALEAQRHRRFVKTHLPVDALPFSPDARYIYVARDGRDVVWSLYNHHRHLTWLAYRFINGTPGLVGAPLTEPVDDVVEYFRQWLARDGYPFWPFWAHVKSWWDIRSLPNVLLVHFADLKRDLRGEIQRVARFLDVDVSEDAWPRILTHCSFDCMKRAATAVPESIGLALKGGVDTFLNRGTSGRWCEVLPMEDVSAYERAAVAKLGPECARWLTLGRVSP